MWSINRINGLNSNLEADLKFTATKCIRIFTLPNILIFELEIPQISKFEKWEDRLVFT